MEVIIAVEIWLCPFRPVPHLAFYPISYILLEIFHSQCLFGAQIFHSDIQARLQFWDTVAPSHFWNPYITGTACPIDKRPSLMCRPILSWRIVAVAKSIGWQLTVTSEKAVNETLHPMDGADDIRRWIQLGCKSCMAWTWFHGISSSRQKFVLHFSYRKIQNKPCNPILTLLNTT